MRNLAGALVILVRLCFSNSCITPVSLALYVRCKCLIWVLITNTLIFDVSKNATDDDFGGIIPKIGNAQLRYICCGSLKCTHRLIKIDFTEMHEILGISR